MNNEKLQKDLEQFFGAYNTMRKYQKKFFGGDKASLRQAMFWENQTDNLFVKVMADYGLRISESKGPASQGAFL